MSKSPGVEANQACFTDYGATDCVYGDHSNIGSYQETDNTQSGRSSRSHIVRAVRRSNSARSTAAATPKEEGDVCQLNRSENRPEGQEEDSNNHGCGGSAPCSVCAPGCIPACGPRHPIVCCSTSPSAIKVLAKFLLFLMMLAGQIYALFCVVSSWKYRHEMMALLLLLLATRLVCRRNWFLPAQYWRNLEPSMHPCCEGVPKEVDLAVPVHCPLRG